MEKIVGQTDDQTDDQTRTKFLDGEYIDLEGDILQRGNIQNVSIGPSLGRSNSKTLQARQRSQERKRSSLFPY